MRCVEFERNKEWSSLVTARIHCLALAQLCFGKFDEEVTLAYCQLARAYLRHRLYKQAEFHANHALERVASSPHENQEAIRVSATSTLGQANMALRKYNKALQLLDQGIRLQEMIFDQYQDETDRTDHDVNEMCELLQAKASVSTHKKEYEEAALSLERAQQCRSAMIGVDHPDMLPIYVKLGKAYLALDGDEGAQRASDVYKRAVSIGIANEKISTPEIGSALYGLGSAMLMMSRYDEAIQHLQRSLKVYKQVYGGKSAAVLRVLRQIALVQVKLHMYEDARDTLEVCVKAEKRVHGSRSSQLAEVQCTRGDVYSLQNDFAEAKKCFMAARSIYESLHGPDHSKVTQLKQRLKRLEQLEGSTASHSNVPRSMRGGVDHLTDADLALLD